MFLKQHSIFDVLTAFGLAFVMYYVIYRYAYKKVPALLRTSKREKGHVLHDLRL
jgi:membrane-associated phospholipid phosphatase